MDADWTKPNLHRKCFILICVESQSQTFVRECSVNAVAKKEPMCTKMTDVNHLSPPGSYRTAATLQDQPKVQQWQPDSNTCSRAAWKDPKAANRRKISPKCRASSRYSTSKKKKYPNSHPLTLRLPLLSCLLLSSFCCHFRRSFFPL